MQQISALRLIIIEIKMGRKKNRIQIGFIDSFFLSQ
jgi:hypothetical protein